MESNAQFRLGFKTGYNGSTIGGLKDQQGIKDVKMLSGYHVGLYAQLKLSIISIQADALYSTQGAKVVSSSDVEYKVENNYVNIPVVAKVHLGPVFLLGGLQYGILTSSKINGVKDDSGFFYTKSDLAIPVGAGVEVKKVTVEARMNIGIFQCK
ncbi:MAG: porin family protein [Cytophagales bacterium]|nr:porin family protein [Cytophagales bacterium]